VRKAEGSLRTEESQMDRLTYIAREPGHFAVTGAPEGFDAYLAAEAARRGKGLVVFVAADGARAAGVQEAAKFFAPDLPALMFPAWDCLPYDRLSPKADIESERLATLAALARRDARDAPMLVVTSVNALVQRVPPRRLIAESSFFARVGGSVDHDALVAFLARNGYARAGTVREPGEFALR